VGDERDSDRFSKQLETDCMPMQHAAIELSPLLIVLLPSYFRFSITAFFDALIHSRFYELKTLHISQ